MRRFEVTRVEHTALFAWVRRGLLALLRVLHAKTVISVFFGSRHPIHLCQANRFIGINERDICIFRKRYKKESELMRMSQNRTKIAALAAAPVLAVAVALTGGVFTHHAVAAASLEQVAVGGITLMDGGHVAFAAHVLIKNVTTSPTFHYSGYVVQEDAMGNSMSGPVTCAFVSDNKARVIWTVNHSDTGGWVKPGSSMLRTMEKPY